MTKEFNAHSIDANSVSVESLIEQIMATHYMLRIDQWRQDHKHWRVGIDWYNAEDFVYICEFPTLSECLVSIIDYINASRSTLNTRVDSE